MPLLSYGFRHAHELYILLGGEVDEVDEVGVAEGVDFLDALPDALFAGDSGGAADSCPSVARSTPPEVACHSAGLPPHAHYLTYTHHNSS